MLSRIAVLRTSLRGGAHIRRMPNFAASLHTSPVQNDSASVSPAQQSTTPTEEEKPGFVKRMTHRVANAFPPYFPTIIVGSLVLERLGLVHYNVDMGLGLIGVFAAYTVWSQFGDALVKTFGDERDAVKKQIQDADQELIDDVKNTVKLHENFMTNYEATRGVFDSALAMSEKISATKELKLRHEVRDMFEDALRRQLQEEKLTASAKHQEIVTDAVAAVEEYLVNSSLEDDLHEQSIQSGSARVYANNYEDTSIEEVRGMFEEPGTVDLTEQIVDPVDLAFYSYLYHRKEDAQAGGEAGVEELPVLDHLLTELKAHMAENYPTGFDMNSIKPLPRLESVRNPEEEPSGAAGSDTSFPTSSFL